MQLGRALTTAMFVLSAVTACGGERRAPIASERAPSPASKSEPMDTTATIALVARSVRPSWAAGVFPRFEIQMKNAGASPVTVVDPPTLGGDLLTLRIAA